MIGTVAAWFLLWIYFPEFGRDRDFGGLLYYMKKYNVI